MNELNGNTGRSWLRLHLARTYHRVAMVRTDRRLRRVLYLCAMAIVAGANAAATWTINHHTWPAAVLALTNALGSLLIMTGSTELLRKKP